MKFNIKNTERVTTRKLEILDTEKDMEEEISKYINKYKKEIDICFPKNYHLIHKGILIDKKKSFNEYELGCSSIITVIPTIKKISKGAYMVIKYLEDLLNNFNERIPETSEHGEYSNEIEKLNSMGFTNNIENERILRLVNGNIEEAIAYLT